MASVTLPQATVIEVNVKVALPANKSAAPGV